MLIKREHLMNLNRVHEANRYVTENMHVIDTLMEDNDGVNALKNFLNDDRVEVRLTTAALLLQAFPTESRQVLEEIRTSFGGRIASEAIFALWSKGGIKPKKA